LQEWLERRVIDPGAPEIRRAAHEGHILNVLRKDERPRLQHEDAPASRLIAHEQAFGHRAPEGAAADDDHVKVAWIPRDRLRGAVQRFS